MRDIFILCIYMYEAGEKSWDEIIPESDRKKIEDEEREQQLMELNLPPRSRKQVQEVAL